MQQGSYDSFTESGAEKWEVIRLIDSKTITINAHKICIFREANSNLTMLGDSTSHATQLGNFFGTKRGRKDGVVLYNKHHRQNHVTWFGHANDPFYVTWTVFMKCWLAGSTWTVSNISHLGISNVHGGIHSLLSDLGSDTGNMNPVTKPKRVKFSHTYSYSEATDTYNQTRISRIQPRGECSDSNTLIQQMSVTWTDFHPKLRRVCNWLSGMSNENRFTMHLKHAKLHMLEGVAEQINDAKGKTVMVIHSLTHQKPSDLFGKHAKLFHTSESFELSQVAPTDTITVFLLPTETFSLEVTYKVMGFLEDFTRNGHMVEAIHAYMCRHNNPAEGQRGAPFLDYMNTGGNKNIVLDQHPTPTCYADLSILLTMYSWDIAKYLVDRLEEQSALVFLRVNASNDANISTQAEEMLTASYPKQHREIVYWIKKQARSVNIPPTVLHCGDTPRTIMDQTSYHVKTMRNVPPSSRSYILLLDQKHLYVHTHLWWVVDAIKWSKGNAKIFVVYTGTERPQISTRRSFNVGGGFISHRN